MLNPICQQAPMPRCTLSSVEILACLILVNVPPQIEKRRQFIPCQFQANLYIYIV